MVQLAEHRGAFLGEEIGREPVAPVRGLHPAMLHDALGLLPVLIGERQVAQLVEVGPLRVRPVAAAAASQKS